MEFAGYIGTIIIPAVAGKAITGRVVPASFDQISPDVVVMVDVVVVKIIDPVEPGKIRIILVVLVNMVFINRGIDQPGCIVGYAG